MNYRCMSRRPSNVYKLLDEEEQKKTDPFPQHRPVVRKMEKVVSTTILPMKMSDAQIVYRKAKFTASLIYYAASQWRGAH